MHTEPLRRLAGGGIVAILCAGFGQAVWSQTPAQAQPDLPIRSLSEAGQGLAVREISPDTGLVRFASSPDRGLLLPLDAAAPAAARALSFVESYGGPFGLQSASQVRSIGGPAQVDPLGFEHVRLQQMHLGVPIRAGELIVHLRGARAMAANGSVVVDLPDNVVPEFPANLARVEAEQLIARVRAEHAADARYSEPQLEILNRSLLSEPGTHPSRLAWFIEASGFALQEFIWVDAQTGAVLLHFSQLPSAKNREVYDAGHTEALGTLVRSEGEPAIGDADSDSAYDFAGITYDYFLTHSRDSYDGLGHKIISTTHYCPSGSCPSYANAFWSGPGQQMVYGDGYASADDVVAHELTHAVTQYSAQLLYYMQSGALNESFSDIFGETVDLGDGVGNDTVGVRWKLGEDLPIGAVRDMMSPGLFGDPAKMSDPNFFCTTRGWTDNPAQDNGGVHINSGVPNHAFALMVDGGTYNGQTIAVLGLTKAAKIQYRALTTYLTSGSGFLDNYNAINQSCTDLIGTGGITAGNCVEVTQAMQAVEMNATWGCAGAVAAPAMCPLGNTPAVSTFEDFEVDLGNWHAANASPGTWSQATGLANGGTSSAYGTNPATPSDHRLEMTAAVLIPAGSRLYFDHAFEFDNSGGLPFDGGVLEYSTNGTTWADAGGLIDAGQAYGGTVDNASGNPLQGRSAFVRSSFGYTATRLNLSSLAGQSVRFRFRIGSGNANASLGWAVDNVALYACVPAAPSGLTATPVSQTQIDLAWTENASDETEIRVERSPDGIDWVQGAVLPANSTSFGNSGLTCGTAYHYRVRAYRGGDNQYSPYASPAVATTQACPPPAAPSGLTATPASSTQINLAWTENATTETSVRVERSPNGTTWTEIASLPANATAYNSAGLTCNTAYQYRVRVHRSGDNQFSTFAGPVGATTQACPPAAPSGLAATPASQTQINLTWTENATNETSVRVERSPNGTTWTEVGNLAANTTSFSSTGLTCNTAYQHRVRVHRSGDNQFSAFAGPVSATTQACPPPAAPSGLVATPASQTQINLTWAENATNETSVRVERSPNGTTWTEIASLPANTSAYSSTGLTCNTAYQHRVRVHRSGDNQFSTFAGPVSATTLACPPPPPSPPPPPTGVTAVPVSPTQIDLTWTENASDETSVRVERSPDGAAWTEIASLAANAAAFSSAGLTCNTAYHYRVRVHRSGDNLFSSFAGPTSATTLACPPPSGPPGPPQAFTAAMVASTLTLTWAPPASGAAPTHYILQAALDPAFGAMVYNESTGSAATALTIPGVPGGTYYLRLLAVNGLGTSGPSGTQQIGGPIPPGAPVLVAAQTGANPISLTWSGGPGGTTTSFTLVAGLAPGASNLGVFPMGTATTVTAAAPIGARIYVRVIAANAFGQATSNEIDFLLAAPTPPGAPTLNPATVATNRNVTLTWTPGSTGSPAASYLVIARMTPTGPVIASVPGIPGTTLTVNAPSGTYFVNVIAMSGAGSSVESNQIRVDVP